jgi:hypothetical protein
MWIIYISESINSQNDTHAGVFSKILPPLPHFSWEKKEYLQDP